MHMLPSGRNPWLTMWTAPRETLREILEAYPEQRVLLLAILAGIAWAFHAAVAQHIGRWNNLWVILLFCVIGGAVLGGVIGIYVGSYLLWRSGRWLGGLASLQQIRIAMVWAFVPLIWSAILYLPLLVLEGKELFVRGALPTTANPLLIFALLTLSFVQWTAYVWHKVVIVLCLAEVQKFSIWKAVANVLLGWAIVGVPIIILIVVAIVLPNLLK